MLPGFWAPRARSRGPTTSRPCFCLPIPLFVPPCSYLVLCPASLLGRAPFRVQRRQSVKAETHHLRTVLSGRAIFVRDPEPVPFEPMPVHASTSHHMRTCVPRQRTILRPSDHHMGLDVIRPSAYTHSAYTRGGQGGVGGRHNLGAHEVRGLCGIGAPLLASNTAQTWTIV